MYFGEIENKIFDAVKLPDNFKKGKITTKIMGDKVLEALKTVEEFQKLETILDYTNIANFNIEPLTYSEAWYSCVIAYVKTGCSEGIYIDWYLLVADHTTRYIGTLKTLDEGFDGYKNMGAIAGMLVMATEAFIYENDKLFLKEEK
jgi:hypothetical protein